MSHNTLPPKVRMAQQRGAKSDGPQVHVLGTWRTCPRVRRLDSWPDVKTYLADVKGLFTFSKLKNQSVSVVYLH